jgi:flagellar basal body rod protein FlgG
LDVTANNVANMDTDGFKKSQATLQEGDSGVIVSISRVETPGALAYSGDEEGGMRKLSNADPGEEIVNLKITKDAYELNLKTIKAEKEMTGALLDIVE